VVRSAKAKAEALALEQRADLDVLPLAGVPIAIKHNLAVEARRPVRFGRHRHPPGDRRPPVVRRLRAAGAVIVGLTAVPELGLWAMTDGEGRITRNPWNTARSTGGSSGGSAAAVAAGWCRWRTATTGSVGAHPGGLLRGVRDQAGRHTVPAEIGIDSWAGMVEKRCSRNHRR